VNRSLHGDFLHGEKQVGREQRLRKLGSSISAVLTRLLHLCLIPTRGERRANGRGVLIRTHRI